jgi:hypothetical protein
VHLAIQNRQKNRVADAGDHTIVRDYTVVRD